MELVLIVVVVIAVVYKLGLFNPIVDLSDVATRETKAYNREHKGKVGKRYLGGDYAFTDEEITKINGNIKAIDELNFD